MVLDLRQSMILYLHHQKYLTLSYLSKLDPEVASLNSKVREGIKQEVRDYVTRYKINPVLSFSLGTDSFMEYFNKYTPHEYKEIFEDETTFYHFKDDDNTNKIFLTGYLELITGTQETIDNKIEEIENRIQYKHQYKRELEINDNISTKKAFGLMEEGLKKQVQFTNSLEKTLFSLKKEYTEENKDKFRELFAKH